MANTYSFPHVEDYIEIIAGYRKPDGSNLVGIMWSPSPLLSLARYDVSMLESLGDQTYSRKVAYTDKQAKLAHSIVIKYERQLNKHNVDITPVKENPVYRAAIREIDRSTRAWVDGDTIKLRFPYHKDTIELIRTESRTSKGSIKFNRDEKVWCADLTENNVNWAYTFSKANNFAIDETLDRAMQLLLTTEQSAYAIELSTEQVDLTITNAANSLVEYVDHVIGGFSTDNLLKLVDYAPILGYTVNPVISDVIVQAYGKRFWTLCNNRELKVDPTDNYFDYIAEIFKYARETDRFPIYIYEPDMSDRLGSTFAGFVPADRLAQLDKRDTITEQTMVVHTRKIPKTQVDRIPLLISSAGMMFGGDRQVWLQTAEKIVYFTKDVYNKNAKPGKEICKLD